MSFKPPSFLHIFHDHPEYWFFHSDWPYFSNSFCHFPFFISYFFSLTAQSGNCKKTALFIIIQIPLQTKYFLVKNLF